MLTPCTLKKHLYQGYHNVFFSDALSSDILASFLPILAAVPLAARYLEDIKSKFARFLVIRGSNSQYLIGQVLACWLCGGLAVLLGMGTAYGLTVLILTPIERVAEAYTPIETRFVGKLALLALNGGLWAVVGMTMSTIITSQNLDLGNGQIVEKVYLADFEIALSDSVTLGSYPVKVTIGIGDPAQAIELPFSLNAVIPQPEPPTTEPSNPTDPTTSTDPSDPSEPSNPTDPTKPDDPTEPSLPQIPTVLEIDSSHIYSGMDMAYEDGYLPRISGGVMKIVLPLKCSSALWDDKLDTSISLDTSASSPFVVENFRKTFYLESVTPKNSSEAQEDIAVLLQIDLDIARVHGHQHIPHIFCGNRVFQSDRHGKAFSRLGGGRLQNSLADIYYRLSGRRVHHRLGNLFDLPVGDGNIQGKGGSYSVPGDIKAGSGDGNGIGAVPTFIGKLNFIGHKVDLPLPLYYSCQLTSAIGNVPEIPSPFPD